MDSSRADIKKLFRKTDELAKDSTIYVERVDAACIVHLDDFDVCLINLGGRNGKRINLALKRSALNKLQLAIKIASEEMKGTPLTEADARIEQWTDMLPKVEEEDVH